jgi:hypothetical protein
MPARVISGVASSAASQLAADAEQLGELRHVPVRHGDGAVGQHLEQPFADQPLQRLAHRRGRDAVARRQIAQHQHLFRREAAGDQPLLDRVVGLVVERLVFEASRHPGPYPSLPARQGDTGIRGVTMPPVARRDNPSHRPFPRPAEAAS